MNLIQRLISPALLAGFFVNAQAFTITPGTLVAVDGSSKRLIEYSTAGTINEMLSLTGIAGVPVGVEVIGSSVYIMEVTGDVSQVNLSTGATSFLFNGGGNEGLGSRGGNLLTLDYSSGVVREYTVGGALVNSWTVAAGGTGVDSAAAGGFSVAYYSDATVGTFSAGGVLVSSFATGLNGYEISGYAYDASTNTHWVSSGFGRDDIRHYSNTGTLLGSFAANSLWINGLDYVSGPQNVPDAGSSMVLLVLAVAGMAALRRRET